MEEPERHRCLTFSAKPGSEPAFRRAAEDTDALVVEVSANTNALLGSSVFIRTEINDLANSIAAEAALEARSAILRWYSKGIMQSSEAVRSAASEEALSLIRGSEVDTALNREILGHARGVRQTPDEMIDDLSALQELLGAPPLLLLSAPNTYTPDGRGISQAPHLLEDMRFVAQTLGAPLIEVARLVQAKGGEFSVMPDLVHLTPAFLSYLSGVVFEHVEAFAAAKSR